MSDLAPRFPKHRKMLWSDTMLDIQQVLMELNLDLPLYIIGGAVRDAFLQYPIKDIDLATSSGAIKTARKIANALNGDFFILDNERDVARILLDTSGGILTVDVAAFRGDDLMADIVGRDFTINAMACDMLGDLQLIIDPLNGEIDAMQKVIRRCSTQSIIDDPIRAMRAIRQSTQLNFRIEPQTISDIRKYGKKVVETSPERIRDEFFKILALQRPTMAIQVLHALDLLEHILPQTRTLKGKELPSPHVFDAWKQTIQTMRNLTAIMNTISYSRNDATAASFSYGILAMQLDRFRKELNKHLESELPNKRSHKALLILAGLLHQLDNAPEVASTIADELRLSTSEKKRLVAIIESYPMTQTLDYQSKLDVHRFWYPLKEKGVGAILLGLADYLATYGNELTQDDWLVQIARALMLFFAYYRQYDTVIDPPLLLNGNDLQELFELKGGPIIGQILRFLREQQVTESVTTRTQAVEAVKNFLG